MNSKLSASFVLLLVVALHAMGGTAEAAKNSAEAPETVSSIAQHYKKFRQITPSFVFVNPDLAMSCVGANPLQIAAARLKSGPHAHTAVLIYMNDLAADAFDDGGTEYPVGAVIVKHKNALDRRNPKQKSAIEFGTGVGGMVKRAPGYDPDFGDWEYFYFEDPKQIETGKIESCAQCHRSAKEKDYVFGTWRDQATREPPEG